MGQGGCPVGGVWVPRSGVGAWVGGCWVGARNWRGGGGGRTFHRSDCIFLYGELCVCGGGGGAGRRSAVT